MLAHWPAPAPGLEDLEALRPGGRPRRLARALADLNVASVALVGHEPDLSLYVSYFIGSRRAQVTMSKAGVAYLRVPGELGKGAASLAWLVSPRWLDGIEAG
jgi:phosphohistidine phosphatase SixA